MRTRRAVGPALRVALATAACLIPSLSLAQPAPTPGQPAPEPAPPAAPAPATAPEPVPATAAQPAPAIAAQPAPAAVPQPAAPVAAPAKPGGDQGASEAASAYVIPDAPAFTILDANPSSIDRPATLTKLGMSLANLVTPSGTVRAGVALEVSVRALGYLDQSSYHAYATDFWTRFLARTALSVGTTADSASATVPARTRLAVGLRLVFIDESDPLLDAAYKRAVHEAIDTKECSDKTDLGEKDECIRKAYNDRKTKFADRRWNYGGLSAAVAQSFAFSEGQLKYGDADQLGAWIAAAVGAGTWFQESFGGKYVHGFDADATSITVSERTRMGSSSFRGSLEFSYSFNHPKKLDVPRAQLIAGAELKVSSSVWISANIGGAVDQASDLATLFAISNIKWNIEPKPSF